jgi:rhodanese-related sulfurtransferase
MKFPGPPDPRRRRSVLLGLLGLAATLSALARPGGPDVVSVAEARRALEAGEVIVVDIREPQEHAGGVIAGARLLPTSQMSRRLLEIPNDPSRPVLLICHTQNRSSRVAAALRERGYAYVRYVHGGMSEWMRRGWPMRPPAP